MLGPSVSTTELQWDYDDMQHFTTMKVLPVIRTLQNLVTTSEGTDASRKVQVQQMASCVIGPSPSLNTCGIERMLNSHNATRSNGTPSMGWIAASTFLLNDDYFQVSACVVAWGKLVAENVVDEVARQWHRSHLFFCK